MSTNLLSIWKIPRAQSESLEHIYLFTIVASCQISLRNRKKVEKGSFQSFSFATGCTGQRKYWGSFPPQIYHLHSMAVLRLKRACSLKHYWITFSPFEQVVLAQETERALSWPKNLRSSGQSDVLVMIVKGSRVGYLVSKPLENTAGQAQKLIILDNKPFQNKA